MQVFKIPRSERIELMKKDIKKMSYEEKKKRRELEGAIKYRLTEKAVITALALIWVFVGLYGQTPLCEVFGIPFAILTLFGGLWIV